MVKYLWSLIFILELFSFRAMAGDISTEDENDDACLIAVGLYAGLEGYECSAFSKVKKKCYIAECTDANGDGEAKFAICNKGRIAGTDDSDSHARDWCINNGDDSSNDKDKDKDRNKDDDRNKGKDSDRSKGESAECKRAREAIDRLKRGDMKQNGTIEYWKEYGKKNNCDLEDDGDGGGSGGLDVDGDGSISYDGGGRVRGGGDLDVGIYGSSDYVSSRNSDPDCYECTIYRGYQESRASGTADIITAIGYGIGQIAQPAAQVWSNHIWANAYEDVQSNWALTARKAQNQCTQRYDNYLSHIDSYGGSPVEADDAIALSRTCNGVPTYAYAGMGGMSGAGMYGGVGNAWTSAGYSPGFISGMMGPYGTNGGINLGMSYPGYGYGYPSSGVGFGMSGYMGAGGFPSYLAGTYGMGGYMGAGGYGNSGYGAGYGSYPYGSSGGFSGGISIGIGTGAGYGYNPYYSGGMNSGWGTGAGVVPPGWQGGSYWDNSGGWGDAYSSWQTQYASQMAYQQQMAAVGARTGYDMYGNQYGNMALQQGAYNTMAGYGSGYNGYYGSPYTSAYGGAGYSMGGISGSFGFGFN